jgi:hypothetical protein
LVRSSRPAEEARERAYTVRLCLVALVGTVFTVVFLGWLWGTIAPQFPGPLESLVENSARSAQKAIEEQAKHFSRE